MGLRTRARGRRPPRGWRWRRAGCVRALVRSCVRACTRLFGHNGCDAGVGSCCQKCRLCKPVQMARRYRPCHSRSGLLHITASVRRKKKTLCILSNYTQLIVVSSFGAAVSNSQTHLANFISMNFIDIILLLRTNT